MNNPFTTNIYEDAWLKHLGNGKQPFSFDLIKGVKFVKHSKLPCYVNFGENITNGMSYQLNGDSANIKSKVALVFDVPDYFPDANQDSDNVKINKIRQYNGVYTDLSGFNSLDDILKASFSSKSRSRFRGRVRQIENNFNISQKVYFGEMSKDDYVREMNALKNLIINRFEQRNVHNTVIPIWEFYEEVMYPLILDKKVAFNVIYNDDEPIAMSLNFVYDDIVAIAIRSFNVDYYKYNIGNYEIYKLFDWCLNNNMRILDFSKGEVGYKSRWATHTYNFYCHVLYNPKSLKARCNASIITRLYKFKQYLRDKNVNHLYTKLLYKVKRVKS